MNCILVSFFHYSMSEMLDFHKKLFYFLGPSPSGWYSANIQTLTSNRKYPTHPSSELPSHVVSALLCWDGLEGEGKDYLVKCLFHSSKLRLCLLNNLPKIPQVVSGSTKHKDASVQTQSFKPSSTRWMFTK